jgi:sirohydrochlorin ferrochelatase
MPSRAFDVADCRNVPALGTSRSHVRLAGQSSKHRRTDEAEEIRNLVAEGVGSRLGADQLPPFHDYVILEGRSAYACAECVPPEYGVAPDYRYAIANQRTRRIVQVID